MSLESIAITGISGRFPNCSNIDDLKKSLFNGTDLVSPSHDRWSAESSGTPSRLGLIQDFEYFDASFFGINPKEANANDPRLRKLLEVTYEALVDAGLNPTELRGSNTGIFLGVTQNDISDLDHIGGFIARSTSILANIVSFRFDFKGPSFSVNTACSSSLYALTCAFDNILAGRCDIAVVGAVQHQVDLAECIELMKLGLLDEEGICRCFDADRKGYVKSEAVVAIVLQKAADCKRIYATIAGLGTHDGGYNTDGIAHPSHLMQQVMFRDVFRQFDIDPLEVNYVEMHCTGTRVGDVEEVEAVDEFYTKGRKTPLLIGSVKSNLGHTETASGLVSIIKAVIAIHEGLIPGNLHFKSPDPEMRGICEGILKVIDRNTPLPPGLIAVNCFGFGGANSIVVLRPYVEKKETAVKMDQRLVYVSGRTEESVQVILEAAVKNKTNEEFLSLIDIYSTPIDNHNYRGYVVLSDESNCHVGKISSKKRPVWYVYAGFGSQWSGMGKDLMKFEICRNTIKKCAAAVKPYGVDLEDVVTNEEEDVLNDNVNIFTGIMAISVALTDLLSSLKIKPSGIIGHSLGEVACAYADGLITAEQATLIAYAKSNATVTSDLITGSMASVGLSVEECTKLLPKGVYIACDNSNENVTISGPEATVKEFLQKLTTLGIFSKLINNAKYPLHSPYLGPAGEKMYNFVKEVLPVVKPRSKRWLSSALPENEWDSDLGRFNSAEYHYHNYMNRVQFKQVLKHIPKDAIVIEVAPKGLLQAILKRALDPSVTVLPLLKQGVDNINFFLNSIGTYYISGGQLDLSKLYKPQKFPVSYDTPIISNLVRWDHGQKWHILKYNPSGSFGCRIDIDMNDQSNKYLEGHSIDGRVMFPTSGYIALVWQAYAKMLQMPQEKCPVVFDNLHILNPFMFSKSASVSIVINIFKFTGNFEISEKANQEVLLVTGRIALTQEIEKEFLVYPPVVETDQNQLKMSHDDFYYMMHLRGFEYGDSFKDVQDCNVEGFAATLKWDNNWVTFMDAMIQYMLSIETSKQCFVTSVEKVVINPEEHLESIGSDSTVVLNYNSRLKSAKCGSIELRNLSTITVKRHANDTPPLLRKYAFVPSLDEQIEAADAFYYSLDVASQIVVENSTVSIKIAQHDSQNAFEILKSTIERVNLKITQFQELKSLDEETAEYFDLLVVSHITKDNVRDCLKRSKYVFGQLQNVSIEDVEIVYKHVSDSDTYTLIRKRQELPKQYTVIVAKNNSFDWISDLKLAVKNFRSPDSRIYLINEDLDSGIVGLFNTIRLERCCQNLRLFLIRDKRTDIFSFTNNFYVDQLKKDLTINIYQDGSWGTYRLLKLTPIQPSVARNVNLVIDNKGLKWVQESPYAKTKNILVYYASIENCDFGEELLGLEYSGVDEEGNKVMGLVQGGAWATSLSPHSKLTWLVPNRLSFAEAATIPLAYTLSYYGLFVRANLSARDRVLVHNFSNNFSMAAVSLLSGTGCSFYIVVSSDNRDNLPKIDNDSIIIHSKKNPFYQTVMEKTRGKGVNVIFNCGTIDVAKLSKNCVTKGGRFIEISNNFDLPSVVDKSCSSYSISVNDIFEESCGTLDTIAHDLETYIQNGTIKPLKYTVFEAQSTDSLMKQMKAKNCDTKYLLEIKESKNKILAYPRTYMDPEKCYIVVGGLGGFGFELVRWLTVRGATKIIINSRRNVRSGYHALTLKKWNSDGITVMVDTSDTTTVEGTESLLNLASSLAPVGGIFNTALHIKDNPMTEQTPQDFNSVVNAKVFSSQNIDNLSRKLCKDLDYFVMFSSLASSVGNENQANYAFANSAVERICETRKAEGFSGMAIEWGPLADVGILYRMKINAQIIETQRQKLSSCMEVVDQFLQRTDPVLTSCVYGDKVDEVDEHKTLVESVAGLFGIKNIEEVDDSKTLLELGMDSLLGFEIKHMLSKAFAVEVSVNDVRNMTFEKIKTLSK